MEVKPAVDASSPSNGPALLQVGALAIRSGVNGAPEALLLTSRETKRWVIPKGWPMKGKKDWEAAAQEAKEEAGIVGKARKKPLGDFLYFKRRAAHFDLCKVVVYRLDYERQLDSYREAGQREKRWFPLNEAADLVDEQGLALLLRGMDSSGFGTT